MNSLNNCLCKQGTLTSDKLAFHVNPSEVCFKEKKKKTLLSSFAWVIFWTFANLGSGLFKVKHC